MKRKKMQSLVLVGRRWWNRRTGNTYHSVEIIVNGNPVHKVSYAYGYDQQFEDTAANWLDTNGYMPGRLFFESSGSKEQIGWYCNRNKIQLYRTVTDVGRKGSL
jgi:hypothetical protein